ncbi:phosducin-like protein 3 [Cyclospora cayetanensis]|uniref:Phosducin n=2 Tax=Cyclospora cayetanensis TaxID=88456 RepID=A0A1D3CST2_9EIME|nr:phosducin-like protein 3 [Cyclospora cayetanensis]OEH74246.1 putative phosducin [Cyclospora cayetanensis]
MSTTNPDQIETEWDQLQRKYGNLPPKPPRETEDQKTKELVNALEEVDTLEGKTLDQLDALEDELDEDTLTKYRNKRIEEMKRQQRRNRFGELLHLGKDDFLTEVTKASAVDPDAQETSESAGSSSQHEQLEQQNCGTWVVLHLYQESASPCVLINRCLATLAANYKEVKFMKAISTDVVPDYPNSRLPTVLLYFGGTCKKQIVGVDEWGGKDINKNTIERALKRFGVLRREGEMAQSDNSSDESDEEKERIRGKGYSSMRLDNLLSRRL